MLVNSNILDFMNHQIYHITLYISTLSWLFQIFLGFPICSHNNFVPSFFPSRDSTTSKKDTHFLVGQNRMTNNFWKLLYLLTYLGSDSFL